MSVTKDFHVTASGNNRGRVLRLVILDIAINSIIKVTEKCEDLMLDVVIVCTHAC